MARCYFSRKPKPSYIQDHSNIRTHILYPHLCADEFLSDWSFKELKQDEVDYDRGHYTDGYNLTPERKHQEES